MAFHMTFEFDDLVTVLDEAMQAGRFSVTNLCNDRMMHSGVTTKEALATIQYGIPAPALEADRVKYVSDDLVVFVALGHGYPDKTLPHAFIVGCTPAFNGHAIKITTSKGTK